MNKERQRQQPPAELEMLRFQWGAEYSIATIDGEYCAARREGDHRSKVLRANTVSSLRRKIVADHAANAVPRGLTSDNYDNGITT
jgi:hypothetical protein